MPRIVAPKGENLVGKVCVCSLGRVGVVTGRGTITFSNGDVQECWQGLGFDGNGLWATGVDKDIVVIAESLEEYRVSIATRPSNFLYGKSAVVVKKS